MTKKKTVKKRTISSSSEAASAFGRLGGRAIAKKRGKSYMQEIGRKGAEARWGKKNKKK